MRRPIRTNGIWDILRHTRIPERDRVLLYGHPEIRLFRGSRSG